MCYADWVKQAIQHPFSVAPLSRRWAQRLALGLTLAVLAGLLLPGCGGDDETESSSKRQANSQDIENELAALQNEFQSAINEFDALPRIEARVLRFTRQYPKESGGYVLLAQVQMRQNDWEGAYDAWVKALQYDPDAFELCKMAGFCAARQGRLKQAEGHYRHAIEVAGDAADCDVYAALGRLYLAMDDPDRAEEAFNRALKAPGAGEEMNWKYEAYSGLANVASERGEFAQAHRLIDEALQRAKDISTADLDGYRIQKARIYMDAGEDADALEMLAVYTWAESPDAQWRIESARLRAKLYERAGQLDKAVNHIALVCDYHQRDPDRRDEQVADFYALLAEWQIKAGQTEAARISLHNLQTLMPEHPQINVLRQKLRSMESSPASG